MTSWKAAKQHRSDLRGKADADTVEVRDKDFVDALSEASTPPFHRDREWPT